MLPLVRALDDRKRLLQQSITVTFAPDKPHALEAKRLAPWTVALHEHADWLQFDAADDGDSRFTVREANIANALARSPAASAPTVHASIISPRSDGKVLRAHASAFARAGFELNVTDASRMIARAIADGEEVASIPVHYAEPRLFYTNGSGAVAELSLLSSGVSDFHGSPSGRIRNIEKALNERVTNIIVPAYTDFSFNDALGDIDLNDGWKEGLAIFGGGTLAPVPGGGICQAATTLYRAAMLAGFPIIKRKSHSLYVAYYEKYGVGIDATVFPGRQDLVFRNDTGHDLVIQSSTEGTMAYTNIYGVPDGRDVNLEGPYFSSTAPKTVLVDGKRPLARNEIAWMRTTTRGQHASSDLLVSRYKAIPKRLPAEYPNAAAYDL